MKTGPTIDLTGITDPELRDAVRNAVVGAAEIRCNVDGHGAWVGEVFTNPAGGWVVVGVRRQHSPVLELAKTLRAARGTYTLNIDGEAVAGRVPDSEYVGTPTLVAGLDDPLPPFECNAHGPLTVDARDVLSLSPRKKSTIRARAQRSG